jgi:hypothetical protein
MRRGAAPAGLPQRETISLLGLCVLIPGAAVLSSLVAWALSQLLLDPLFHYVERSTLLDYVPVSWTVPGWAAAELGTSLQKRVLCFAIFGGVLSMGLTAAIWIALRRRSPIAAALVFAVVLGHVFGGTGGWIGPFTSHHMARVGPSEAAQANYATWVVHTGIVAHTASWIVLSIGVGLSAAIPLHELARPWTVVRGALTGGAVSGVLFFFASAAFFPAEQTDWLIPTGRANQLLWIMLTSLLIAAGVLRSLRHDLRRARPDALVAQN